MKKYIDIILLVLMGMLSFSSLASYVSQNYLHISLSAPEVFFIPLFLLLKHKFEPIRFDKDTFAKLIILLVLLVLWSQVLGTYPLYSVLSSARGYLYLFLFYCIYKKNSSFDKVTLILICFGSIIGWFITSYFNFQLLISDTTQGHQDYGNMITVALFIIYTIMLKRWKLFAVGFVMILGICIFSGIRRVIFVVLLAMAAAVLIQVLVSKKSIIKQALFVGIIFIPIYFALPLLEQQIEELSPILHMRLFEKTEQLMEGDMSSGDDFRKTHIEAFFNNPLDNMIPKGMVSNQYLSDKGTGIFMDFPLFALAHMFGFIIALFIVAYYLIKGYKSFLLYKITKDENVGATAILSVIFFSLLFVEGSFLVYPFATPFTGMFLGRMVFYARQYDIRRRRLGLSEVGV